MEAYKRSFVNAVRWRIVEIVITSIVTLAVTGSLSAAIALETSGIISEDSTP